MKYLSFKPFPFLSHPLLQTILGSKLKGFAPLSTFTEYVDLSDGDRIALEVATPKVWLSSGQILLLVHGLGGSHEATYMQRIGGRFFNHHYKVVLMNCRGCGSGVSTAKGIAHSGRSEDIKAIVKSLKKANSDASIDIIGFSLSGNAVLKMAGEWGREACDYINRIVSVCPPVDLVRSSKLISQRKNKVFEWYFMNKLMKLVKVRHEAYPDLPAPKQMNLNMSLYDFDDIYTAPHAGFKSADDYYKKASSLPLLPKIKVPTKILISLDDPIIDSTQLCKLEMPKHVQLFVTHKGGHMGYLGREAGLNGWRWLDNKLVEWLS